MNILTELHYWQVEFVLDQDISRNLAYPVFLNEVRLRSAICLSLRVTSRNLEIK